MRNHAASIVKDPEPESVRPEAMYLPSGLYATEFTLPATRPRTRGLGGCTFKSQMTTSPFLLPETRYSPFGLYATLDTSPVAYSEKTCPPVFVSQISTEP